MNISQSIIFYRKKAGLSQYQLSKESGISQKSIGAYEEGRAIPPIKKLELIAKALGISVSVLTGEKEIEINLQEEKMLHHRYSRLSEEKKKIVDFILMG
jgi:transcriptional regulator with XRE-family HTH domain